MATSYDEGWMNEEERREEHPASREKLLAAQWNNDFILGF
jgi:hypothetical protein